MFPRIPRLGRVSEIFSLQKKSLCAIQSYTQFLYPRMKDLGGGPECFFVIIGSFTLIDFL